MVKFKDVHWLAHLIKSCIEHILLAKKVFQWSLIWWLVKGLKIRDSLFWHLVLRYLPFCPNFFVFVAIEWEIKYEGAHDTQIIGTQLICLLMLWFEHGLLFYINLAANWLSFGEVQVHGLDCLWIDVNAPCACCSSLKLILVLQTLW